MQSIAQPRSKAKSFKQMIMKTNRLTFTAMLLLAGYFASAQNLPALDQTLGALQKQATETPFEKVYLHLDKPYYGAGDTVWFKAYLVTGAQHYLSGISYVLNVDLIDEQSVIKKSIKLPVVNGLTFGDIVLADTIPEGNYRIRAYTNWMRNFGAEYFFDKTIRIVNAVNSKVFTRATYSYAKQNGQQTVNTDIVYTDLSGKPYSKREVKYEVGLGGKPVTKGKGTTDETGNLHLSFISPAGASSGTGEIFTEIRLDDQKTVDKLIPIKATSTDVDVQFFPESGSLVNGIASKIAFKATGADGLGADVKGSITDAQNNLVGSFNSAHLGMGTFMLAPQQGKNYIANITFPDGRQSVVALPRAVDKGYVITINNADTLNNVIVAINGNRAAEQSGGVTLVGQSGEKICFEGKGKPGQTEFTAVIPKSRFPSGIVQFTLFDSVTGEPLNERLVFIQNPDQLKLELSSPKTPYAPRKNVKIDLNATNKEGKPVQGNFSVAVVDETFVPVDEAAESTILSSILLSSDIKGYIEQPNYYFTNTNSKTATDLDALMLTQGYHRFEWKQIINNSWPEITFQPERSITISGQVKTLGGKPVVKGKVSLFSKSDGLFLVDTVTDKNGRFTFNMIFADSSKFTIKALSSRGKENVELKLDVIPQPIKTNKNTADVMVNLSKGIEPFLRNNYDHYEAALKYGIGDHTILLKEISISKIRPKYARQLAEERAVEFSSNLNGKGQSDQVITADDIEQYGGATLFDVLNGRIAGVEFRRDSNGNLAPYSIRSSNQLNGPAQPMTFVIDGMFGRDITLIPVSQIGSVEVLRSMNYLAAYGSRASNGILLITTKHGGQDQTPANSFNGTIEYSPMGYYKARQFYSPKYDHPARVTNMPDLRTTIFWKPIIETDKDGNASIDFFNADGKGKYRVVVEGIDYKTGSLGRRVYHYTVE